MSAVKLNVFGGMVPAVDDRLLPDRAAAHSENTWLYSGALRGVPQPTLVRACSTGTTRVYRIPESYSSGSVIDNSLWLEFENPYTDVIRAPVIDDQFDRYYWASSTLAPMYNTRERIANGDDPWLLGIPQPEQPGLTASGGVGDLVARAYLTTWVSAYGEEGPASTPIVVTGRPDDTWALTFTAASSTDLGDVGHVRYLEKTRIYRTVTSDAGVATYFLVAEIDIATLSYNDILADTEVASNNQLESTNWTGPPSDLEGWVSMPNGIIAGWRLNEIWFCEPYRPHAWPSAYTLVVDYPISGLGVTGQALTVCTQGNPHTVYGIHPASMAQSKIAALEPCLSRGSILSTTEGVYYASPNGLIFAGQGFANNITKELLSKERWQELTSLTTIFAARVGSAYYGFGTSLVGAFDPVAFHQLAFAPEELNSAYTGFLLDPTDQRIGFNLLSDTSAVTSISNDAWSGDLFVIKSNNLYKVDLAAADPVRRVYLWRSKVFQSSHARNFGAMKIYWRIPTAAAPSEANPPANPEVAAEFPKLPGGSTYGVVRLYADSTLVMTRDLTTSGQIVRGPSGFKAQFWQIEFETYVDIYSVQMAPTVKELSQV